MSVLQNQCLLTLARQARVGYGRSTGPDGTQVISSILEAADMADERRPHRTAGRVVMSGAAELHSHVATPVHGLPDTPVVEVLNLSDLPADLQDILRPRVERLGYLGAFFSLAGHQPEALGGFITFTEALKQALPADLAEVVALTVAARLGVEYELTQHRRLARTMRLSQTWIDAVTSTVERPGKLTSEQQGVRDLSHAVLDDFGRSARPAFERLVDVLGAAKAVAVLLLISRYVAHGCVANTLGLTAPTAMQSVRPGG